MYRRQFFKGSAIVGVSLALPNLLKGSFGLTDSKGYRTVYRILNTSKEKVGTLPILRAFAGDQNDYVSPYVLFDEFGPVNLTPNSQPLRVDAHPHAGIVPTTYFLSGNGHHRDSLNYDFQIGRGDFMMFTSGRGAIHMEETGQKLYEEGGLYHGFQIWLNMPAKYKFSAPATDVHREDKMANLKTKDYAAKVILGELFGAKSKIELLSPAFYYHIQVKPNGKLEIPVNPTHNVFVYVIKGTIETSGNKIVNTNQVALFERGKDLVPVFSKEGADVLVLGGQSLQEPVYSYGPFVMNTEAEIKQCIQNYQSGKMGNPEVVNGRR
ncbi:MAG: pirin family protein [Bacteroidia bacterium]|nr:pirin family protein [Bacteroidia bacterium]